VCNSIDGIAESDTITGMEERASYVQVEEDNRAMSEGVEAMRGSSAARGA
jgi:hypothetical protein